MPKTLLIADDSATIRKIVELTFRNTEVRVESVDSGRGAMESWGAGQHDLVLVDVFMPDVSGYEICRSIKGSANPVPVLLLAGTFEPFDVDLARECGADGHLIKPFESDALRSEARALLERHATRARTLDQSQFQQAEADGSIDDLVQEIDDLPPVPREESAGVLEEFPGDEAFPAERPIEELPEEPVRESTDESSDEVTHGVGPEVAHEVASDAVAEARFEPPVQIPVQIRSDPDHDPESAAAAIDEPLPAPAAGDETSADPALVEAVVQAVLARMSADVVRDVAHELVPDIAARIVRERIREIEEQG